MHRRKKTPLGTQRGRVEMREEIGDRRERKRKKE